MLADGQKDFKRQVLPVFDGLGPTQARWRVVAAQGEIGGWKLRWSRAGSALS
jgi:hypothetical protein